MSIKRFFLISIGVVLLALGFLLGKLCSPGNPDKLVDILLYGEESEIIELANAGLDETNPLYVSPLFKAVQYLTADCGLIPPIASDQKLWLLNIFSHSEVIPRMCQSLALGAIQDADAKVREKCVEALDLIADSGLMSSLWMIERHLNLEKDKELRLKKEALLKRYTMQEVDEIPEETKP